MCAYEMACLLTFNQRVTGSNPVALTTLSINITNLCEGWLS